ncbi:MAG: ABC transporter permease [Promethearchaeota archaeon]
MMKATHFITHLQRSFVITRKDIRIYYNKGPVVMLGLLMPFFIFLSFYIGRDLPSTTLIIVIFAMTIYFSATSMGPAVMPWEARFKTLERLLSAPISLWSIILGNILASFIFGLVLSIVPFILSLYFGVDVIDPIIIILAIILASFCFSTFSVLLSIPPTDEVPQIMMLSTIIKFPLLFISGIFIPLNEMSDESILLSLISPLTYFVDLLNFSILGDSYFPVILDLFALSIFIIVFFVVSVKIHTKTAQKRI